MEYFAIVNLVREPFSNSPEPDFFYQSPTHVRCLQQLELAIRLRRGLNVVMGRVGTGKTTLCRRLIAQLAGDDPADAVETHLLMDPSFATPREFLTAVAADFGIAGRRKRRASAEETPTDWQIKEQIKAYLFKKGVDEKKIVVLIIDEGQKLPDFCLEMVREFLNYETNEHKLLQIVLFGQPELQQALDRLEYVADRVNLLYRLTPLHFQETREMIRHRLAQASEPGCVPSLFTLPGFLAIYRATGGYPRRIVTLCHQVVLALIIQNRSRAGWFLVRSCAKRLSALGKTQQPARSLRWVPATLVAFAALLMFFALRPLTNSSVKTPDPSRREGEAVSVPARPPVAERQNPRETIPEGPPVAAPVRQGKPDLLGTLALKDGRTIWWMLTDFYGRSDGTIVRAVARANPHIKNLGRVQAGEGIVLPALPARRSLSGADACRLQVMASTSIEEAYEFYRSHKPTLPSLRFLPYWNAREGLVFAVLFGEGFPDEAAAREGVGRLPGLLASGAQVRTHWEQDTIFYRP